MPLCRSCQRFDIQRFKEDPDGLRGYRINALMQSADAEGCEFCDLLVAALDHISQFDLERSWMHMSLCKSGLPTFGCEKEDLPFNRLRVFLGPRQLDRLYFPGLSLTNDDRPSWQPTLSGGSYLPLTYFEDARLFQRGHFGVAADPGTPAQTSGDIGGQYLGEDRTGNEFLLGMTGWLKKCIESHHSCSVVNHGSHGETLLPSRCLDLSEDQIKLRETRGHHGHYLTLSHHWDSQTEQCKTTTLNYDSRLVGKDLDQLSKTFMDAIYVTRRLGYKYLWIDSLCIVQDGDDGRDWRAEATKMAQYYNYSVLTIAALPRDISSGFLSPRDTPILKETVRLPYRSPEGGYEGHFHVYKTEQMPEQRFWLAVRQGLLLKRGWIFQEWVLSRRILWFTPEGVFFECQNDAEPVITELNEVLNLSNVDAEGKALLRLKQTFLSFGKQTFDDSWYLVIESYSTADLSYPAKDRLLAIAGVARHFLNAANKDDGQDSNVAQVPVYASGLWLQDIYHGLLWEQRPTSLDYKRACQAPTWSWASLTAGVHWSERCAGIRNACDIHRVPKPNASSSSEDDELTTMNNRLSIRGRLLPVFAQGHFSEPDLDMAILASDHEPHLDRRFTPQRSHSVWYDFLSWLKGARLPEAYEQPDTTFVDRGFQDSRQNWKMISPATNPDVIGGWGSFEQPISSELPTSSSNSLYDLSNDSDDISAGAAMDSPIEVYCLHISTRTISSQPGWHFGYLNTYHPVLNVLYLRQTGWSEDGVRRYERVGVGRIFDKQMISAFQLSKDQNIELE